MGRRPIPLTRSVYLHAYTGILGQTGAPLEQDLGKFNLPTLTNEDQDSYAPSFPRSGSCSSPCCGTISRISDCGLREAVWTYQLGGYPVVKKWLGYRQANRRAGQPLTLDESKSLRQIIQRIAALLALGPHLDALYQDTAADAITAKELAIHR